SLEVPFFNQPWIAKSYRPGMELAVSGRLGTYRGKVQLANQEVEVLRGENDMVHTGRITPVHRAAEGVTTRTIRELVYSAPQRRAMKEVGADMRSTKPMNRLLQGDVGSGKTVVALYGAMVAIGSGHQATIMAPTEVLAGQHARTVRMLLAPIGGRDLLELP